MSSRPGEDDLVRECPYCSHLSRPNVVAGESLGLEEGHCGWHNRRTHHSYGENPKDIWENHGKTLTSHTFHGLSSFSPLIFLKRQFSGGLRYTGTIFRHTQMMV